MATEIKRADLQIIEKLNIKIAKMQLTRTGRLLKECFPDILMLNEKSK